jgi:hypothetical protein
VEFEDNHQRIRFRTPGGEVSGLTFGDRIFNFVGKGNEIQQFRSVLRLLKLDIRRTDL